MNVDYLYASTPWLTHTSSTLIRQKNSNTACTRVQQVCSWKAP